MIITESEISAIYDSIAVYHFQLQATMIERYMGLILWILILNQQYD